MVLHFRAPPAGAPPLERTVRFMRKTFTNIVACIASSALIEDEAAWECAIEGTLDALAERLAYEPDGVAKAFVIGDTLANRVRRLQDARALGQ